MIRQILLLVTILAPVVSVAEPSATPTTKPATQPSTRPSQAAVTLPGSLIMLDVAYVDQPTPLQTLDVYAPSDAKGAPVVVFVHGGEWAKGDKSNVSVKPKFFNSNGVIFISLNYRLSGTDRHPAQVDDISSALRWTRDNIEKFGGDRKKILLMGHSAGCHMVTLVGLDAQYLAKVGMKPSDLAGVISWSGGAFDLPEKVAQGGMYADFIHQNFGDDTADWKAASPMHHIADGKPQTAFLFASAEQGNPASKVATDKMVSLITAAGGSAQNIMLQGKTHFTAIHEMGMKDDVTGYQFMQFMNAATAKR
jgi:arylformamidase